MAGSITLIPTIKALAKLQAVLHIHIHVQEPSQAALPPARLATAKSHEFKPQSDPLTGCLPKNNRLQGLEVPFGLKVLFVVVSALPGSKAQGLKEKILNSPPSNEKP